MSTDCGQGLRALSAAAALYTTLSACTVTSAPLVTHTPRATAVLRGLPTTAAAIQRLTPSFVVPTPAPIGPTATPHTYTILPGDTLIAIADEHGVTVEALQLVNPGIDPLTLQVGNKMIIPFAGADVTTGFLPSPTPLPVSLSTFRCHLTPSTGQLCLGEAHNDSRQAIINLAAQVTVVLSDGELGPSQITFAPVEIVMPGESVPLAARFADVGAVWGATAQVVAAQDGSALEERFLSLAVGAAAGAISASGQYTVTAEIMNESVEAVSAISGLISCYNAEDELRAFRIVEFTNNLRPGESAELAATFTVPAKEIFRFSVSASGRVVAQ